MAGALLFLTPSFIGFPLAADPVPAHESFTIQSKALGEPRTINVHLPPQYGAEPGAPAERFPVLYMPDGGLDEDFPHVVHMVDSLTAARAIRPVIVVGIPNTERRRDLTGPTAVKSDSAIAPHVGGSSAFRKFLGAELMPEIERRYRTTEERTIIGESLAGLFIVETFLEEPGLFTHYVALDPSLWWNAGSLVRSAESLVARLDTVPRSMYLASSREPSSAVGSARLDSLIRVMAPKGLRWQYEPRPDLEHSTIFRGLEATAIVHACGFDEAGSFNIWPGPAPGSETWTQKERRVDDTPLGTVIFNVVTPTLTPYLPAAGTATGTGVIIAPGGAFVALALDLEGRSLARWLHARGIAAFVLKYRLVEKRQDGIPTMDMDTAGRYGIADGIRAIRVLRSRASEWGLSPSRIGIVGFSAGAMVASGTVLLADSSARPAFAGMIYGGPFGVMPAIPAHLPPLFLAWAEDDAVAGKAMRRLETALDSSGQPAEVHIYSAGGHGFGLRHQGTSSDYWVEAFHAWLVAQGFGTLRR